MPVGERLDGTKDTGIIVIPSKCYLKTLISRFIGGGARPPKKTKRQLGNIARHGSGTVEAQ